jgi:hypothetical protein
MEQPSIGSNNSQFRGGVQGHTGQLTTCPVPDRVDKIPACFLTVNIALLGFYLDCHAGV